MTGNISMGGLYSLTDINNIILTGSGTPTISNSGELALTAWMATIDATTGNQIVGWSVLTNQIALLAPAGGGGDPIDGRAATNDVDMGLNSITNASFVRATSLVGNGNLITGLDAANVSGVMGTVTGINSNMIAAATDAAYRATAGGGSQTPWTNNVDAAGFALTALDYTSMNTNAAAVTGVAGKLVQYILNDRLYSVYDSVTNYAVLN